MEWQSNIRDLYDKVVLKIPESVRPVVKSALFEKAEKKCSERSGRVVSEVDLVVALFEVTPAAFQPTMKQDLKEIGVDYDKYLARVESDFKCNNDLNQMVADISKLCEIMGGVDFNEKAIWNTLNVYDEFFKTSPVSIRATTKPLGKRDVSTRYVEFMKPHNPDPYTTAINTGLIEKDDHPIHEMIMEVINTFEIMGYGVDIDSRVGFKKIWPFIVPASLDSIISLKNLPPSVRKYKNYFQKHDLEFFLLFAFDFLHKTMNLYIMLQQPPQASYNSCLSLVEDLGFEVLSREEMEGCTKAAHLNYTFSWDSEEIERVCFGITCHTPNEVPVQFHPLIKDFVEQTPLQSDSQKFIWGITFTHNGTYYKIENDYNGTMVDFLEMGCKGGIKTYR